ncbi:MAG: hypothetical protein FJW99_01035 [Actinobacteria bacterium]|nr:hypothetical protein [Actinomycetota bacterium]
MRLRYLAPALLVVSLALAGTAMAGTVEQFTTPTRNIGCIASDTEGVTVLRCDIRTFTYSRPKKPANCPLKYGDSLSLSETGRARWTCHGDTALPPPGGKGIRTIKYGVTWERGPFTCTSRVTALECRSDDGHGFRLSRLKAERFVVRADG